MLLRAQGQSHHVQVLLLDITFAHLLALILDLDRLDRVLVFKDLFLLRSLWKHGVGWLLFFQGTVDMVLDLGRLRRSFFLEKLIRSDLGLLEVIVVHDPEVVLIGVLLDGILSETVVLARGRLLLARVIHQHFLVELGLLL